LLVDLRNKGTGGKTIAQALDKAGIIVNYNMIPYDPSTPFKPSGIRLGTPAVTSRGMVEKDMVKIAGFINQAVENLSDDVELAKIREQVINFTSSFKVPGLDT